MMMMNDSRGAETGRRALAMLERGDHSRAIPYLEARLHAFPDDTDLRLALGKAYAGAGQYDRAIPHLEHMLKLLPDHGEGHRVLGRAHLALGEHDRAAPLLERAVDLTPDDDRAWLALGRLRLAQGRPVEAENAFRQAEGAGGRGARLQALLGRALHDQGRSDEALAVLDMALASHPETAVVQFQLGEVHRLRGNHHVAVERYRAARDLGMETLRCDLGLARALHGSGELGEAERELETLTRTHDRAPEPWFHLGRVREDEGDTDGALVCYERCLSLEPDHAGALERRMTLRRTTTGR